MVCLTSWGSQGLPVYTVGARGWHPDRGLSHLLKMQVQRSNISRQEDAFEFKLLQQFGLIPRAPPGQGLTRSPVEGGVNYS